MNHAKKLLSVTLLVTLLANSAQAEFLLFERTLNLNRSVNIFDTELFDFDLIFADSQFNPTNPVTLFDGLTFSPSDVGTTFEANLVSDPQFGTVAGRITDGLNEFVTISATEVQSNVEIEQRIIQEAFFFDQFLTPTTPDLVGQTVGSVRLRLDSFTLLDDAEAALNPGLDAVDLNLTIKFFSTIPEPNTMLLLAISGAVALATRRRGYALK